MFSLKNSYYLRKALKKSFYRTATAACAPALFRPFYGGIGSILLFHRVTSPGSQRSLFNGALETTPEYLEHAILSLRKNGYDIVSLDAIHTLLLEGKRPAKPVVAFTFDDGYADNFTLALPIFSKYNAPFAIYIATCFPEGNAILWWYLLEDLLVQHNRIHISHDKDGELDIACSTLGEKGQAFYWLSKYILEAADSNQLLLRLNQIFDPYHVNLHEKTRELALTWDQIGILARNPVVTIGAHGINHLSLKPLSAEHAFEEIAGSKRILETRLSTEMRHFAYPYGSWSDADVREFSMVKTAGFNTATTTKSGNLSTAHNGYLHCLPRIFVDGEISNTRNRYLDVSMHVVPAVTNKLRRFVY